MKPTLTLNAIYTLDGLRLRLTKIKSGGAVCVLQILNADGSDNVGTHPNYHNQTRGVRIVSRRIGEMKAV